ncbi:hypothetical protein Pcinc_038952 [Petrolisthes cinctipes]|uniref:BZIP domain-containing protein n=1 Tax=Petrolisthes cinctipes TaxID=88211 RepID=A0AAE1BQT1_PETCI|nr:hypothetical protein Pcinc_038952 [Petrolisthes cinctipes]
MNDRVGGGGGTLTTGVPHHLMERLYSGIHPSYQPSQELSMDAQPLDFSTKKGKTSSSASGSETGEHSDSDRGSPAAEGPNHNSVMGLALRLQAHSRDSESGFSFSSTSPDNGISPRRAGSPARAGSSPCAVSPMAHSPVRSTHHTYGHMSHAPLPPPVPQVLSSALLAQLHANPLLYSTLKSALARPTVTPGRHDRYYLPQSSHSPPSHLPPSDFAISPESIRRAPSPRQLSATSNLGVNGLGARGLGGTGLGSGGFGNIGLGGTGLSSAGLVDTGLETNSVGLGTRTQHPHHLSPHGVGPLDGLGSVGTTPVATGSGGGVVHSSPSQMIINVQSNEEYRRFREQMMIRVTAAKVRRNTSRRSSHSNGTLAYNTLEGDTSKSSGEEGSPGPEIDVCNINSDGNNGYGPGLMDMEEPKGRTETCEDEARTDTENGGMSNQTGQWGTKRRGRQNSGCVKDDAYWERRRKNNEAAKRSRDARRAKEDEIAIRAAFLEQENLKLRVEVASLKSETAKLRCMLYNS